MRSRARTVPVLLVVIALAALAFPALTRAGLSDPTAQQREPAPGDWRDGYSLVLLRPGENLAKAQTWLELLGMRVAVVFPPRALLGWMPASTVDAVDRATADVYTSPIDPASLPGELDSATVSALEFFNSVLDRTLRWGEPPPTGALPLLDDALDHPDLETEAWRENLASAGIDADGALPAGNSDQMRGNVTVNVFFVESDGSIDRDLYTWTSSAVQDTLARLASATSWWSSQAGLRGQSLTFYVNSYAPSDARCRTGYESIRHPHNDAPLWIDRVLTNFGYASGSFLTKAMSFNAWARSYFGTQWAYSAFIEYNPYPAGDRFTDGYAGWAYLGGPLTNLLYRTFGWTFDRVFAHETGHIFWACDEYYQAGYGGCTSCGSCYGGPINGNCEYCNPYAVPCMMRRNDWTLCSYTPSQLGWASAPPLPTATATRTPSRTPTRTGTASASRTPTATATRTPSRTPTPTASRTATRTSTSTATRTRTSAPPVGPTNTATRTRTPTPSGGQSLTVPITSDTWITAWNPTVNGGRNLSMGVRSGAVFKSVALADLPANIMGRSIQSATLRMYVIDRTNSGTGTLYVHRLLCAWGETTATWNVPWAVPGVGAGSDFESSPVGFVALGAERVWIEIDVTAAVRAWVAGAQNHGLLLSYVSDVSTCYRLATRHYLNFEPKLIIRLAP